LASGGAGRDSVRLFDLSTHGQPVILSAEDSLFSFVKFSSDGRWLTARGMDGKLHLWRPPSRAETGAEEKTL